MSFNLIAKARDLDDSERWADEHAGPGYFIMGPYRSEYDDEWRIYCRTYLPINSVVSYPHDANIRARLQARQDAMEMAKIHKARIERVCRKLGIP